jgi:4-alpha-glucanotransferase
MSEEKRAAGILLAVSSLPSRYGIGSFGEAAWQWIDFLAEAGQRYWQILPLGPTSWGDSPYMSFSAFAMSPYYIDLDILCEQKLLDKADVEGLDWGQRSDRVDYALLYQNRERVLRRAFARFRDGQFRDRHIDAFHTFCTENAAWLADFCLFMAIKQRNDGHSWLEWDEAARLRDKRFLETHVGTDTQFHSFVQFMAFSQWQAVKEYAGSKGVSIIGDMPIYVALDSADVWANSELFQLDEQRKPTRVAGCPPDAFASTGQLWGNPLYRWDIIAETRFSWWLSRLKANFSLYDVVRIDHFRGFESYYSIPFGAPDASTGTWVKGPGLDFVNAVNEALPVAAIIAEDLGYLTPEVRALLAASGYPGMKVLQFAFDSREDSDYMPYTYTRNCVVYTATHDNTTTFGWFKTAHPEDVALAKEFFGTEDDGVWAYIRTVLSSVANLAIVPMQDYLVLDDSARMNTPSTVGGSNWQWRLLSSAANTELARKIAKLTRINGRL